MSPQGAAARPRRPAEELFGEDSQPPCRCPFGSFTSPRLWRTGALRAHGLAETWMGGSHAESSSASRINISSAAASVWLFHNITLSYHPPPPVGASGRPGGGNLGPGPRA